MPRAVAVGLPEPAPQISASPRGCQSHLSHAGERIWRESNCYRDLRGETLHALGLDSVPAFTCALSADHDGLQWTFLKQQPEDLRRPYALEVTEEIVWLPLLETVSIDAPGWIPSDNFFHLLAATPYSVRLQRCCDQAAPPGKVASVDSLGTATITASA
jgi:Domain of unknown function (DUF1839)